MRASRSHLARTLAAATPAHVRSARTRVWTRRGTTAMSARLSQTTRRGSGNRASGSTGGLSQSWLPSSSARSGAIPSVAKARAAATRSAQMIPTASTS